MSEMELYRCTPRQVAKFATNIISTRRVPFVHGSPGIGKSSIFRQIAKKHRLKLIDHRLSTSAPEDLSGLPEFYTDDEGVRRARFVPFNIFPTEKTPVPEGYDGWLLFLDEANAAAKSVQAASYKLTLDREVGQEKLHPRCAVAMAGNLATDRAIVNPLSTAMQSRIIHLEMMIDHREWLEDVAFAESYDERIIAFLNYKPEYLMDFRPDHNDKTFCSPRTWEFVNDLSKVAEINNENTPMYAGAITSGVAVSFVQFCAVRDQMPDRKRILADPTGCNLPQDAATKWMVISHLSEHVNDETFGPFSIYCNRFGIEHRILFYRSTMIRHPKLRMHPSFDQAMGQLSQYLHGN